jgi:hypothetical protein
MSDTQKDIVATPGRDVVDTDAGYSGSDISAADLKKKLKNVTEKANVIEQFIRENFTEGVDFAIAFAGADKKTLTKAGSEKICLLFNVEAKFRKDEETLSMIGETKGVICFLCELIDRKTGRVVSEGRGACTTAEKGNKINTAIKIAQKRAKVDAVLNMAGLSDRFTQDKGDDETEDDGIGREARQLIDELAKVAPKKEAYDKIVTKITDPKKKWSTLEHRMLQKAAMETLERVKRVETQKATVAQEKKPEATVQVAPTKEGLDSAPKIPVKDVKVVPGSQSSLL